ncbi:hypothetical protein [Nocardia iowensis]|uniref:hypothetical protein n=1 Tax=Nocardia iowensis TaxID=204891 RepID=UPI0031E901A4
MLFIVILILIVGVVLAVCWLILRSVRLGAIQIDVVPLNPPRISTEHTEGEPR